jgi:hypothetical protein
MNQCRNNGSDLPLIYKSKLKTMKSVLAYENNFYPYNGQFIPQGGDNVFLDFEIDGNRFFLVKFRTIDLANNQIILSIVKL